MEVGLASDNSDLLPASAHLPTQFASEGLAKRVESNTETMQSLQLVGDAIKEGSMSSHVCASRLLPSASESSETVVADISPIFSKACECPSRHTSQCKANVAKGTSGQTLLNNPVCKRSSSQKRVV